MRSKIVLPLNILVYGLISVSVLCILYLAISFHLSAEPPLLPCLEREFVDSDAALKFLNDRYDKEINDLKDSCGQLMRSKGSLKCLDNNNLLYKFISCPIEKSIWQPTGCNMHQYHKREIAECMGKIPSMRKKKEILMLGDSRIRHLYMSLKHKLQNKTVPAFRSKILRGNFEDLETGITLNFYTRLHIDAQTMEHLRKIIVGKDRPVLLLLGIALHTIKDTNGTAEGLRAYRQNFTEMVPLLENLTSTTTVIWMLQSPVIVDHSANNNLLVQLYNNVAMEILSGTRIPLMYSARSIGIATQTNYMDVTHLGVAGDNMIVEVLINYLCNKYVIMQDTNVCCR